jgi:hypothetical protein
MRYLVILALFIPLLAGAGQLGRPQSSSSFADPNEKAASYSGELDLWRRAPESILNECNKLDPSAAQARQETYQRWLAAHGNVIKRIDDINRRVAERLSPKVQASGADPAEVFRAQTIIHLDRMMYNMAPGRKLQVCGDYLNLPMFGDARILASQNEAFNFLDKWLLTENTKK